MTSSIYCVDEASTRRTFLKSAAALASTLLLPALMPSGAQAQGAPGGTLNIVPQADLRILDPVWTSLQITTNHGYMVYDTLFSLDADLHPQPQMLDSFEASDDHKSFRFTLREGLKWHDGSPVTARDCVASLKRWGARSAEGRVMGDRGATYKSVDERSFTLEFSAPFAMVQVALANPTNPCFMMREQEASTDPYTQITTAVGSGPFIFVENEWKPGHQVVYRRNPDYAPRNEPPSGLAGGKIAKVDQVIWRNIPDNATAANALVVGEVDMLEFPAHDLLAMMAADPNIEVKIIDPIGYQGMLRINSLAHPFDKPAARQAVLHLVQAKQDEYLAAMVGLSDYQKICLSPFVCGSPNYSEVGLEAFTKDNVDERVRSLFAEAGYKGEPLVVLDPTDQHVQHMTSLVLAQHLRQAGINVDLQATDWGTVGSRRAVKAEPSKDPNGWHIFPTWWPGFTMQNPVANIALETTCEQKNWFGWPCDQKMEELRAAYVDSSLDEERRTVMNAIQKRFFEVVPYVPVGQFLRPVAFRKDRLSGVIATQNPVFWNIQKTS